MIHADYQEALENLDVNPDYPRSMSMSKGFAQSHPSQTGMSINLKGRKKYSESVKEMFPMPEFNSYLSDPTKKKNRMKVRKPHTAAIGFRSKGNLNTKVIFTVNFRKRRHSHLCRPSRRLIMPQRLSRNPSFPSLAQPTSIEPVPPISAREI